MNLFGSIRTVDTSLTSEILQKHSTLGCDGRHISISFVGILLVAGRHGNSGEGKSHIFNILEVHILLLFEIC